MSEDLLGKVELSVGERYSSREEAIKSLQREGVQVAKTTVSELRSGRTNGEVLRNRRLCAERLTSDDASLKDKLYIEILKKFLELRAQQRNLPHRFDTNFYPQAVAESLDKDQHDIGRLLQAMRVDLVLTDPDNSNQELAVLIKSLAERFISAQSTPEFRANPPIRAVDQSWDHKTVANFYRVLSTQGIRFITTWVPYEAEAMAKFYETLQAGGNKLTPFDIYALATILKAETSDDEMAAQIRSETGLIVNAHTIQFHRNCLVYGTPVSALKTRG